MAWLPPGREIDTSTFIIFVRDFAQEGKLSIEHCPTEDMVADFMKKPLQGSKFR